MEQQIIAVANSNQNEELCSLTVSGVVYPINDLLEKLPDALYGSEQIWAIEFALITAVLNVSNATHVDDQCFADRPIPCKEYLTLRQW